MKRSEKILAFVVVVLIYAILFCVAKELTNGNSGLHFTF